VEHNFIWIGMRGYLAERSPSLFSRVKGAGLLALGSTSFVKALSLTAPLWGRFFSAAPPPLRFGERRWGRHSEGEVRVLLFPDLLADLVVQNLAEDLLTFLVETGFEVKVLKEPLYSGVPEINNGKPELAKLRAARLVEKLKESGCDWALSPDETFVSAYNRDYKVIGVIPPPTPRVVPLLNFVVEFGLDGRLRGKGERLYVNESCHLFNLQKLTRSPYQLLKEVGDEPVKGEYSDVCCGFGGSFSFAHSREGRDFALRKFEEAERLGADAILVFSSGCYFHLNRWRKSGKIRVVHFCTYLRERVLEQERV
jgi:Fe-S oxidoreductase